jgi:hypothetical protein
MLEAREDRLQFYYEKRGLIVTGRGRKALVILKMKVGIDLHHYVRNV